MRFKDMPSWLKGGVVGIIINIILFLFPFLLSKLTSGEYHKILSITHYPFIIYNMAFNYSGFEYFGGPRFWSETTLAGFFHIIIGLLITIVFYFLIGAIIGYIISKLKPK